MFNIFKAVLDEAIPSSLGTTLSHVENKGLLKTRLAANITVKTVLFRTTYTVSVLGILLKLTDRAVDKQLLPNWNEKSNRTSKTKLSNVYYPFKYKKIYKLPLIQGPRSKPTDHVTTFIAVVAGPVANIAKSWKLVRNQVWDLSKMLDLQKP